MAKKRIVFEVSAKEYREARKQALGMHLRSAAAFARWYFYLALDKARTRQ